MPTILITGASRGLGHSLAARYLLQPNTTVIAANRSANPLSLPAHPTSTLLVLPYDAASPTAATTLIDTLVTKHGITHLDVVIANAGIMKAFPLVRDVTQAQILEHTQVNVFGVVALYQATRALLLKGEKPVFVSMGSGSASLSNQYPLPNAAYGSGKAMLNWFGMKIDAEEDKILSVVLDPGFVQTDGGNWSAQQFGMDKPPLTVDESVDGMMRVLGSLEKAKHGGRVVDWNGEVKDW